MTDRNAFDSPELGIELLSALHHLYPEFQLAKAAHLVANVDTMRALDNEKTLARLPRAGRPIWPPSNSGAKPICSIK